MQSTTNEKTETMSKEAPKTEKEPKKTGAARGAAAAPAQSDPPEGFERCTTDVAGFYDGESSIRFTPIEVKAFDGYQDTTKPSCLIIGRLNATAKLRQKNDDGEPGTVVGKAGDMVGVWYKPGMRDIVNLAGIEVFVRPGGEKDIGKGNPMKVFELFTRGSQRGQPLLVTLDQRDDSADVNLPFKISAAAQAARSGDDNVPY
jgi:hypothetical protein